MTQNWGDFCTFCGVATPGDSFPKKCLNGHWTYASPVSVSVALQPVMVNGRTGILALQRNIEPFTGGFALPGGFMDNFEMPEPAAARELHEETGVVQQIDKARYFSSGTGGSHRKDDPRSHTMHFIAFPALQEDAIDLRREDSEVQKMEILFLSNDRKALQHADGTPITLCFSTHHAAAITFLSTI